MRFRQVRNYKCAFVKSVSSINSNFKPKLFILVVKVCFRVVDLLCNHNSTDLSTNSNKTFCFVFIKK